jgi:hypothetical protein
VYRYEADATSAALVVLRISVATLACPCCSATWSGVCPDCTRVSARITSSLRPHTLVPSAKGSACLCFTLEVRFTSHPPAISSFTAPVCPKNAADQIGVCPPAWGRGSVGWGGVVVEASGCGGHIYYIYVHTHNASQVFSSDILLLHNSNTNIYIYYIYIYIHTYIHT